MYTEYGVAASLEVLKYKLTDYTKEEWKEHMGDSFTFMETFLVPTGKYSTEMLCPVRSLCSSNECKMYIKGDYAYCSGKYDEPGKRKPSKDNHGICGYEDCTFEELYYAEELYCDVMRHDNVDMQIYHFDIDKFWHSARCTKEWEDICPPPRTIILPISDLIDAGLIRIGTYSKDDIGTYNLFFTFAVADDNDDVLKYIDLLNNKSDTHYILICLDVFDRVKERMQRRISLMNPNSIIVSIDDILKHDDDEFIATPIDEVIKGAIEKKLSISDKNEQDRSVSKYIFHYNDYRWLINYKGLEFAIKYRKRQLSVAILLAHPKTTYHTQILYDLIQQEHLYVNKSSKRKTLGVISDNNQLVSEEYSSNSRPHPYGKVDYHKLNNYIKAYKHINKLINDYHLSGDVEKEQEYIERRKVFYLHINSMQGYTPQLKETNNIRAQVQRTIEDIEERLTDLKYITVTNKGAKKQDFVYNRPECEELLKFIENTISVSKDVAVFEPLDAKCEWDVILPSSAV